MIFFGICVLTRAKHVLSVSYDLPLLTTRQLLLEQAGYRVTSAESLKEAAKCMKDRYDLFILGHSIPLGDKEKLIKTFRTNCPAPVLSLQRRGEEDVSDADYRAFPDRPDELMQLVKTVLSKGPSAGALQ